MSRFKRKRPMGTDAMGRTCQIKKAKSNTTVSQRKASVVFIELRWPANTQRFKKVFIMFKCK